MTEGKKSYAQILRASSIMGGAAGFTMLLSMVRVKVAALTLGGAGVGLLASLTAIQTLVSTLAALGIQMSGVRDVAAAAAKDDDAAVGRAALTLRRICWLTGLVGMLALIALSPLLSRTTFATDRYTADIAALGLVILFVNLTSGQMAFIQGVRRIGDIARANVFGAALSTAIAVALYLWLGLRGIVPSLIAIAAAQLLVSYYFARRVAVPRVALGWLDSLREGAGMVRLGVVFMWNGLLTSAVTYLIVTLVGQYAGLPSVGLYSAALALSGIFVNFVLSAMGADFYPRLVGTADDLPALNRLVNEQTEIGVLLALPGLLGTLALAPWVLQIFYSHEFIGAADLLRWFILGCMGRIISWPLGFVMLALGKGRWYLVTETSANALHAALVAIGLLTIGIQGVAMAFFALYVFYTMGVYLVARRLTGFAWSSECSRIVGLAVVALAVTSLATVILPFWPSTIVGVLAAAIASFYSLHQLVRSLGPQHPISRFARHAHIIRPAPDV